jgi:hypothetical protein
VFPDQPGPGVEAAAVPTEWNGSDEHIVAEISLAQLADAVAAVEPKAPLAVPPKFA